MADHTEVRLETPDGTVVAYLAPNFEVEPSFGNDLHEAERAGSRPTVVRDNQQYSHTLSVRGVFEDAEALPGPHRDALRAIFPTDARPITARDQVNRLLAFVVEQGGPFHLYEGSDEYTATSASEVDLAVGVYPVVNVDSVKPPSQGGLSRFEYTIEFVVGVPG